jgi:hypothetical protein
VTRQTARCDWAGCTQPSATCEDGWEHCDTHLLEHRAERDGTEPDHINARIIEMHAQGIQDRRIATAVGLEISTVRKRRLALGLPAIGRSGPEPKPCGTTAAYRRHQRRGETPCQVCRDTFNAKRRLNAYPPVFKGRSRAS